MRGQRLMTALTLQRRAPAGAHRAPAHGWFGHESPTATGTPHFRHSSTAAATAPTRHCTGAARHVSGRLVVHGDDAARTSSTMKI